MKEHFERHGYNVDDDNFEEIAIKEDYIKTANNKWKNKYEKGGKVEKKGNEMIIGGLAGFLLGMFLNK